MTDYVALKAEIIKPAYDGMTDVQIAAAVNLLTVTVKRSIATQPAINKLIFVANGDWAKVSGVVSGVITENNQAARLNAIGIFELFTRNTVWDTSSDTEWTAFLTAIDTLVTQGRMSAAGKAILVALGRPVVNFAASIGWPSGVGDGDVAAARNLP